MDRIAAALERIADAMEREPGAEVCHHTEEERIQRGAMGRDRWDCGICGYHHDEPITRTAA